MASPRDTSKIPFDHSIAFVDESGQIDPVTS